MIETILALVISVQAAIAPGAERYGEAADIAKAIAYAVAAEASPVLESRELDAAVLAVWAWKESNNRARAVGDGGRSCGAWQETCASPTVAYTPKLAAARELDLARAGVVICPEQPFAPLSGGCKAARKLADRRVAWARRLLEKVRGVAEVQP